MCFSHCIIRIICICAKYRQEKQLKLALFVTDMKINTFCCYFHLKLQRETAEGATGLMLQTSASSIFIPKRQEIQ